MLINHGKHNLIVFRWFSSTSADFSIAKIHALHIRFRRHRTDALKSSAHVLSYRRFMCRPDGLCPAGWGAMLEGLLSDQPEIALFACLAAGHLIASVRVGPVSPRSVCGTLITALVIGQAGIRLDTDLKSIAFALFIFALGSTGEPRFFSNIRNGQRLGILSVIEVISVLAIAACTEMALHLDPGTASGLLAGAALSSARLPKRSRSSGRRPGKSRACRPTSRLHTAFAICSAC
ncbi:hypothetical protein [Burkholderia oklahomensis]|uniref:aspartate-alanine antiporter-like transporter n=1 Tax=Burkholderia oklahomensis TaxID=342113 RepID=UPI0005D9BA51|nr:hypothetical protein [Burkholderia oklahomensis]AJX34015.1 putative Permease Membrane Region family protein [Burkholderia oklahomensis C6786]SUY27392.1 putative transporter [Burkholderia oklahomensis]